MKGKDGMGSAKNRTAILAFFGKFGKVRKLFAKLENAACQRSVA